MLPVLLQEIRACRLCVDHLPHGPRPVVQAAASARLLIIGQAPGRKVHDTGIPWNDASGATLRDWLQLPPEVFYDPNKIAIVPAGFCYPGKGKSGDLPPRPECAPRWHAPLRVLLPEIRLTLLVGRHAQLLALGDNPGSNLTTTVKDFMALLTRPGASPMFPLPHPSPRNRAWFTLNPWFADEVLPVLRQRVAATLKD